MPQLPYTQADDEAIERFVQKTMQLIAVMDESGSVDRSVIVCGLFSLGASLAIEDLAKRPGTIMLYLRALQQIVDAIVAEAPTRPDARH